MPFAPPDLNAPLDWAARERALPPHATAKGMFLQDVVAELTAKGLTPVTGARHYIAFKSYPGADYVALLRQFAEAANPVKPHQALELFGRQIYPRFESTLVGRSIFAFAGRDFAAICKLATKAYQVSIDPGRVDVLEMRDGYVKIGLRDIWSFPESLQVGTWRGAMQVARVKGEIAVELLSPNDANFEIRWQPAP